MGVLTVSFVPIDRYMNTGLGRYEVYDDEETEEQSEDSKRQWRLMKHIMYVLVGISK